MGNNTYKIEAKVSLGTARISGVGIPIGVWMDIKDNETLNPTVLISSEARGEHFFLVVLFGIMLVITALSNEPWYLPLSIFGVFFVVHFWFHLVYRAQENELINQIKGQLKLQERNL